MRMLEMRRLPEGQLDTSTGARGIAPRSPMALVPVGADFSRLNLTWSMRKTSVFAIGGRSSMVEPQIVVLAVAGSSPVGHPISS